MAQIRGRPDDGRLGLARAYLATRSGRFDQARVELEAVLNRRDDDPVVWRAWLDWAMAAGETGPVCEALAHLPAGLFDAGRVQGLRAWLAVRQHDAQAERRALEQRLAEDPSDPASLTRLAELLHEAGDKPAAARLRRRKADLDVTAIATSGSTRTQPFRRSSGRAGAAGGPIGPSVRGAWVLGIGPGEGTG